MGFNRIILLVLLIASLVLLGLSIARFRAGEFAPSGRRRSAPAFEPRICVVYSDKYQIRLAGLERLHSFDINKYSKIYRALIANGSLKPEDVFIPEPVRRNDLLRVHSSAYLDLLREPEMVARYLEFGPAKLAPVSWTDDLILKPFRHVTGGTILAGRLALRYGMAVNLGGGYHHAEPDSGGGFCIYADMPIAIRVLQAENLIARALVVDLDVHQGNGTALCLAEDDRVFTFDIHQADLYPFPKPRNSKDIALQAGVSDAQYLEILCAELPAVFDAAAPDMVFLQAGVDVLLDDELADLRMSAEGVQQRDELVFAEAVRREIPIVMVLGGGYSDHAWHVQYRSISSLISKYGLKGSGRPPPRRETEKKEKSNR